MNNHLRNAETQIAADLENLVVRFIKTKKHRYDLSKKIVKQANELAQACELIHGQEPRLPSPIPPLPDKYRDFFTIDSISQVTIEPEEIYYFNANSGHGFGHTLGSCYWQNGRFNKDLLIHDGITHWKVTKPGCAAGQPDSKVENITSTRFQ